MRIVIVTGMSGAGKSTALKVLEDAGYYCVDNMPIALMEKFIELAITGNADISNIALGIDIRSGQSFGNFAEVLKRLKEMRIKYEILFLDANDTVLIKRFKETRRSHPLATMSGRVDKGIELERAATAFLKSRLIIL